MLTSLDNFLSFGANVIAARQDYLDMVVDIYETTMQSTALGAQDRVAACKLAESVLLNVRGGADPVSIGDKFRKSLRQLSAGRRDLRQSVYVLPKTH